MIDGYPQIVSASSKLARHQPPFISTVKDAVEYFSVTVGANEMITVDVDFASFDSVIELIGPDGTTVLANNDDDALWSRSNGHSACHE